MLTLLIVYTEGAIVASKTKQSNSSYNARRRFVRLAERMVKKARGATGKAAARYRAQARDAVEKAAQLYERQADIQRSQKFTDLANEFGVNLSEYLTAGEQNKRQRERREQLISESLEVTETLIDPNTGKRRRRSERERRDMEARAILNSPIGSRIYGGLVDIWAQPTFRDGELVYKKGRDEINRAIMEYFGVDSMMDVIELLEKETNLYADPESMEKYDAVTLVIVNSLYR